MEGRFPMILTVENVSCTVPSRTLFSGLSLSVEGGQSLAVVGPSGSGKSTLLAAILGMTHPSKGRIEVAGEEISSAKPAQAAQIRREHIGVVFQDGELLPELTAAENIAVALMLNQPGGKEPRIEKARKLLEEVGVPADTRAADLSGGERQRTALVRALATDPELVLADEPTGSLDTITRDAVAEQLFATVRERGAALLVVTHDPTVAARADATLDLAAYTA
ncbi:ABC transporter ATP-binding protein [Actinobaculum sp. 352]|nr:ABC transporter ATP-binding protein [Actinobaculum sp. 352]